ELYREWERGEYQPYGDDLLIDTLIKIKKITPPFVRIDRLVRDISKQWVSAGTYLSNMRQVIHHKMATENWQCQCIRCREARGKSIPDDRTLHDLAIPTLGATEHFLTYESSNDLYSLLRLRLPDHENGNLFPELTGAAIIREVHTYGTALEVGRAGELGKSQHMGLGKKLIKQAEQIAHDAGYNKIAVISAIGTRGYYRKLGYNLDGLYMVKTL
ncbi:MAG: tRNA uridine(34) 5-carboxymethylaminomethyl modification radical SAM/GNAT enzyme Elp3, partial [Thermoprotei archaeon]